MQTTLTLRNSRPGAIQQGGASVSLLSRVLTRELLFAGLFVVTFVNGTTIRVVLEAGQVGWLPAASNTFGISVLVWAALGLGIRFLLQAPQSPICTSDWLVAALVLALALLPVAMLSWLAMTGLALSLAFTASKESQQQRGAWIFFGLTVPMFWSRELFASLSDYILELEAVLVGAAINSPRVGNMVQFADGSGYMQIWPACSSFGNVSLAVLCWVMLSQVTGYNGSRSQAVGWCGLACAGVVLINSTRITLIGIFPKHYDLLHGSIGTSIAGWLTLLVSAGICAIGVRHRQDRVTVPRTAHV